MVIFTKYSNERDPAFRIRTDILLRQGEKAVRKTAASGEAFAHIRRIFDSYTLLESDLKDSGLFVNACRQEGEALLFPWAEGRTLEQRLDELLSQNRLDELEQVIADYFALFDGRNGSSPGCTLPFSQTREFTEVFGHVNLPPSLSCRAVSDIDMIFCNAIEREDGYELIDYEWTFVFPIPVKYIEYRCLHYYVYGNESRQMLAGRDLFARFGISRGEQEEFAKMEQRFQQYMLGSYTPVWKLYDRISEGVIDISSVAERESEKKRRREVEVYYDDGRGFGVWNWKKYRVLREGPVTLRLFVPKGTKQMRVDPGSCACLVRLKELSQNGVRLPFGSNGMTAPGGDLIFDTDDPQIWFPVQGDAPVRMEYLMEPVSGLAREAILGQQGRIRWMEQTKVWRLYRRLRRLRRAE